MPQTLENQAKPLYCRHFSWFPHMYTRCENRIEKGPKIEAKTTPNPLKNYTNFEPKTNAIKNKKKTNLKRQCAETCSKRVSKKRPKSGASNFKLTSLPHETLYSEKHPRKTQCFRQKKLLFRRWSPIRSKWSPKDVKMVPMWVKMVPMGVKFVSFWSHFFENCRAFRFVFHYSGKDSETYTRKLRRVFKIGGRSVLFFIAFCDWFCVQSTAHEGKSVPPQRWKPRGEHPMKPRTDSEQRQRRLYAHWGTVAGRPKAIG